MPSLESLHRLLEATPGDPFVPYAIAQEHAKQRAFAEAVAWYDRCLAVDGAYCYAYYHKARAQLAMGGRADALRTIEAGRKQAAASGDGHAGAELSALRDEIEDEP
ncbi:MAG: hypothetical protein IT433_00245 [Phycisphaerales bacterium]|nr:hypothetical protein [Phycisphaerales bacterium]